MESKYLMGQSDGLSRQPSSEPAETFVSQRLRSNLIAAGLQEAYEFYARFFGIEIGSQDYQQLAADFQSSFQDACSLGLLKPGGIGEQDYLNLWALVRVFAPKLYIESGVFVGSSLHVFVTAPSVQKIIGIDPYLSNLKINVDAIGDCELIDDRDFSQVELDCDSSSALAYFDDHIDTAARVLQASDKGLRYLLFDDSTGIQGICQRLYPAIPTIPMIMNCDLWAPGDEVSWTFKERTGEKRKSIAGIFAKTASPKYTRVTLSLDEELHRRCRHARSKIVQATRLPDLGDYMPQLYPDKMFDTTKYLVELVT